MPKTLPAAFLHNFLGHSPDWYKLTIIGFLVANPVLLITAGPVITGWVLLFEFIFTLMMALKCYPLQPGGLLAIEAAVLGLVTPHEIYHEVQAGLPVILLLMFMVAGIYFLREVLVYIFTKLLVQVKSKTLLAFVLLLAGAVLSAFLDALTVLAVMITVTGGFYGVYHRVASGKQAHHESHDESTDDEVQDSWRNELDDFRAFLRNLMMHGAIGTTIGGVCTLGGRAAEPAHRPGSRMAVRPVRSRDVAGHDSNGDGWPADLRPGREASLVQLRGRDARQCTGDPGGI